MNPQRGDAWKRRGCSLLWDAAALAEVAAPAEVISIRQFFALARSWPAELPWHRWHGAGGGRGRGVPGRPERCRRPHVAGGRSQAAVLRSQDEYEGQAALILWLPSAAAASAWSPRPRNTSGRTAARRAPAACRPGAASGPAPRRTSPASSSPTPAAQRRRPGVGRALPPAPVVI